MTTTFAIISMLAYAQFCQPSLKQNDQEMIISTEQSAPMPTINYTPEPNSTTVIMSADIVEESEALIRLKRDIQRKQNQVYIWYAAMTTLAGLTGYYALTTPSDQWLPGTAGSFGANFSLTTIGTIMAKCDLAAMRLDYRQDFTRSKRKDNIQ